MDWVSLVVDAVSERLVITDVSDETWQVWQASQL